MKIIAIDKDCLALTFWQELSYKLQADSVLCQEYIVQSRAIASQAPTIIVVDTTLFSNNTLRMLTTIVNDNPAAAIVVTGKGLSTEKVVELLKHGAHWVFAKDLNLAIVEAALPEILQIANDGFQALEDYANLDQLFAEISSREHSVLKLVLDGVSNQKIADQLGVSVRTVEARRSKIYRKLQVRTVTELVRKVDHISSLKHRFQSIEPVHSIEISKREFHLRSIIASKSSSKLPGQVEFHGNN